MLEAATRPHSLVANHSVATALLDGVGPSNWATIRARGIAAFRELGIPTHKHEEWKYTPLRMLEDLTLKPAYGANVFREDLAGTPLADFDAYIEWLKQIDRPHRLLDRLRIPLIR